jgi:hypothetical protein
LPSPRQPLPLPAGEFASLGILGATIGPAPAAVGPSAELLTLTTMEQVRDATVQVAASAQRLLSIVTNDMEPLIYDQTPFLEVIKRFVLGRAFGKVRVLVKDTGRMNATHHRFVAMARRLSSCLELRVHHPDPDQPRLAYCIADDRALIVRPDAKSWTAFLSLDNPSAARLHLQDFDRAWYAGADQHQRVSNL